MLKITHAALAAALSLTALPAFADCTVVVPFASGSTSINASSQATLARLAEVYPTNAMRMTGHTDSVGNAAANQRLSARRLQAVERALVSRGVSQGAIVGSTALGESVQRVNSGGANLANRRVEIRVAGCDAAVLNGGATPIARPGNGLAGSMGSGGAVGVGLGALLLAVAVGSSSGT